MAYIDVDLDEFDDDELIREVRGRMGGWTSEEISGLFEGLNGDADIGRRGLALLKAEGCPTEFLAPIEDWLRQDKITIAHLRGYLSRVAS